MNAPRDPNFIPVVLGASTVDGTTLPISIDHITGYVIAVFNYASISYLPITGNLKRDDNFVPVMGGASTSDNTTILGIQINQPTGAIVGKYT